MDCPRRLTQTRVAPAGPGRTFDEIRSRTALCRGAGKGSLFGLFPQTMLKLGDF